MVYFREVISFSLLAFITQISTPPAGPFHHGYYIIQQVLYSMLPVWQGADRTVKERWALSLY